MLSLDSPFDPVEVRVRNTGRSTAEYIKIAVNADGQALDTERPCSWSKQRIAAIALGPGQELTYVTPRIKINNGTANRILAQRAKMFLWFSINYSDAFGAKEETPSCFVVMGTGMSHRWHPPANPWRPCEAADLKRGARTTCAE